MVLRQLQIGRYRFDWFPDQKDVDVVTWDDVIQSFGVQEFSQPVRHFLGKYLLMPWKDLRCCSETSPSMARLFREGQVHLGGSRSDRHGHGQWDDVMPHFLIQ